MKIVNKFKNATITTGFIVVSPLSLFTAIVADLPSSSKTSSPHGFSGITLTCPGINRNYGLVIFLKMGELFFITDGGNGFWNLHKWFYVLRVWPVSMFKEFDLITRVPQYV
ncbi:hypothetical protein K1719_036073 [Acacia pycnantha]|nr:hypothetical protein K1719_036073 [Acacia pycnantha]